MAAEDTLVSNTMYGVSKGFDLHGNSITSLRSHRQIKIRTVRERSLFDIDQTGRTDGLAKYIEHGKSSKRRILVIIDKNLSDYHKKSIEDYFQWCQKDRLFECHSIMQLDVGAAQKPLSKVEAVLAAAKQFKLKRRDLFIAIGNHAMTDITGFAAAIFRRSTPWILISTDGVGVLRASWCSQKLALHYVGSNGATHLNLLAVSHNPIVSLYDPSCLASLQEEQIKLVIVELIRTAAVGCGSLFSYVEEHAGAMLRGPHAHEFLATAIELAVQVAARTYDNSSSQQDTDPDPIQPRDDALFTFINNQGIHESASLSLSFALISAVATTQNLLLGHELNRILDLLVRTGLPTRHTLIDAHAISDHLTNLCQGREQCCSILVSAGLGRAGYLHGSDFTPDNVRDALLLLAKHCPSNFPLDSENVSMAHMEDSGALGIKTVDAKFSEDVFYQVVSAPRLFHPDNTTLARHFSTNDRNPGKMKLLVITDKNLDCHMPSISEYFKAHNSSFARFRIRSMEINSTGKNLGAVQEVIQEALDMDLCQCDLIIVIGGGTLMDVVGFAAAMYKGGIPYVRIPTTLVGMLDAGVGVKVGVNFGLHKNLLGRYYAPIACLNDMDAFLQTLPQREFACGMAEAVKMAIIKSPDLFDIIERHGVESEYNHTHEVIQISVYTMLEELQPNLFEDNLRRLVDFGHEFGHIIESLARYEIPHGECVSVGIAISSCFARQKSLLSHRELERILDCLLSLQLPIYLEEHNCCDADTLWVKISTDGTSQKDGMLHLVVPQAIGQGTFLDSLSEIDADMLKLTMLMLKQFADKRSKVKSSPKTSRADDHLSHIDSIPNALGTIPQLSAFDEQDMSSGDSPTVAIIGASGDIGLQLSLYLQREGRRVICSVRGSSLSKFRGKMLSMESQTRTLVGDVLNLANLQTMIQEAKVVYNMAGIVALNAKPSEFSKVIALNGLTQGVIACLIRRMGREEHIKMIFPSSQRVHLIAPNKNVEAWIRAITASYNQHQNALMAEEDVYNALERFAKHFLQAHALPKGCNVYEVSKLLGEHFVGQLPRHSLVRISSVYGPTFTRGFVYRAIHPGTQRSTVAAEKRDMIFIDDLTELLVKAGTIWSTKHEVFDAASGESIELRRLWRMLRNMIGDSPAVTLEAGEPRETMSPDPKFARGLLNREFTPMRLALQQSIWGSLGDQGTGDTRHLQIMRKPCVLVVDVGATHLRFGILSSFGHLLEQPIRLKSPNKELYPHYNLHMLQEEFLRIIVEQCEKIRLSHGSLHLEEIGISFGAVITHAGIVRDASILWGSPACGFDLGEALQKKLSFVQVTILNDISAAAWRYSEEGRFCLITVSSGLSNKVFNPSLEEVTKLDLDVAGVGGEMGHVVVEAQRVDALVNHVRSDILHHPEAYGGSKLESIARCNASDLTAHHLGQAANEGDDYTLRFLDEADIPYCLCGNLADLCSYGSGPAALRLARKFASRAEHGLQREQITDAWLSKAIKGNHPLALKVLKQSTYHLALRILQLAADLGLDQFIIVGGFALKTAGSAYIEALRSHLANMCSYSAFYSGWDEGRVRKLVRLGNNDDNDGLIGVGMYVQHLRNQNLVLEKAIGEASLTVARKAIPRCGVKEVLTKVVYAGVCTTDLQILRGERGLEPVILGHEGVCQVLEVGSQVEGLDKGDIIVMNPNNPLDDYDKIGHTREGLFQEYYKFGQEFLDRKQVLKLDRSAVSPTYTLIEPLSCVVAAQERIRERVPGKNVLVVGAGLMGLLFVTMNEKMGARSVLLTNRSKARLDFAVATGIVKTNKAFQIGSKVASDVERCTAGQGVDIVIICVSLGQGVQAAQDAISYVNPGGCVYLFAGFRPNDMLTLEGKVALDAWSIRVDWKTERIQAAGKSVDVSGHRGSRLPDFEMATSLIQADVSGFSKIVSHIVSFRALQNSILSLAENGCLHGNAARRMIVDVEAHGQVVEQFQNLPLRHLQESSRRARDAIPVGNVFREIGFDGSKSMLGWVHPPIWQAVDVIIKAALSLDSLRSKRDYIWIGTGAWGFLVDACKQTMPEDMDITFHIHQTLDPQALLDIMSSIHDLSKVVCIGMSQSGTTTETVMLMHTWREYFDASGLDYRAHFVWLTDTPSTIHNHMVGERTSHDHAKYSWNGVDTIPLETKGFADINALFSAPHSSAMFLASALSLDKDMEALQHAYKDYCLYRDDVTHEVLSGALFVASNHIEDFHIHVDREIVGGVSRLIVQSVEQALGSKEAGFNPRAHVKSAVIVSDEPGNIRIQMPAQVSALTKIMLTMNAISVFIAAVAYHRRISFVAHPRVDLYKRRAAELIVSDPIVHTLSDVKTVCDTVTTYLRNNVCVTFVDVLCYGHLESSLQQSLEDELLISLAPINKPSIAIHQGDHWNHSRYQAAVQRQDTVYVVLVQQDFIKVVHSISKETIRNNVRMLQSIARATYETLLPYTLYFEV